MYYRLRVYSGPYTPPPREWPTSDRKTISRPTPQVGLADHIFVSNSDRAVAHAHVCDRYVPTSAWVDHTLRRRNGV